MAGNPYGQQLTFPQDFTFVRANGYLEPAWFYYLFGQYQKLGGQGGIPTTSLADGGTIEIAGGVAAGVPVVEAVGASPYTFTATAVGMLTVDSGAVTMTRGTAGPYSVGAAGAQLILLPGDVVVVTFGAAPNVVWWPGGFV